VRVSLQARPGALALTIEDDGRGFNVGKRLSDPHQAFGLITMRQRIELLGGKLKVDSRAARQGRAQAGTRIEVELPSEEIEAA
jgi:signal transduction histidine kinase